MEALTSTLVERVQDLVSTDEAPQWGSPLLSTTPAPLAIHHLAVHLAAAEKALIEIAAEVQRMADEIQKLAAQTR